MGSFIYSKLYHFLSSVADLMILSILWLIFCIPVFTIGSATAALYYTIQKVIREGGAGTIRTFWNAFRDNFKQGTILTGLILAVLTVLMAVTFLVPPAEAERSSVIKANMVLLSLGAYLVIWMHYLFSYIARFQDPLLTVIKNTLIISLANLAQSMAILMLFVFLTITCYLMLPAFMPLILLIPGVYAWISGFLLESVYKRYSP